MSIAKTTDLASTALYQKCIMGDVIPSGTLTLLNGKTPCLKYKMTKIFIASYQLSGHGSDVLLESIGLHYEKINMTYTPPTP